MGFNGFSSNRTQRDDVMKLFQNKFNENNNLSFSEAKRNIQNPIEMRKEKFFYDDEKNISAVIKDDKSIETDDKCVQTGDKCIQTDGIKTCSRKVSSKLLFAIIILVLICQNTFFFLSLNKK